MKYLIITLVGLFFVQAADAAQPCYQHACDSIEAEMSCGPNATGGYICMVESTCEVQCKCPNANQEFWFNQGCFCKGGFYGMMSCTACPSGGTSDGANNLMVTSCYTSSNVHSDSAHATVKQICYYSTSTNSYSSCSVSSVVSCDAGYYRVNASDMSCTSVGANYYSVSPFSRSLCPTYTNPSGGSSYGQTTGSGTGADAATDCKIPESEVFSDSAGSFVYSGGCSYSN